MVCTCQHSHLPFQFIKRSPITHPRSTFRPAASSIFHITSSHRISSHFSSLHKNHQQLSLTNTQTHKHLTSPHLCLIYHPIFKMGVFDKIIEKVKSIGKKKETPAATTAEPTTAPEPTVPAAEAPAPVEPVVAKAEEPVAAPAA